MKRWIVYLLPLLFCACQGSKMRSELQRVDSLNSSDALLDTITTMPEVVDYFDLWGSDNERMTAPSAMPTPRLTIVTTAASAVSMVRWPTSFIASVPLA